MSVKDTEYLKKTQEKLKCKGSKCGEHFTLTIGDNELEHLTEAKQEYAGICGKCQNGIKVKGKDLTMFKRTMGEPKIVITKSTLSNKNLFE